MSTRPPRIIFFDGVGAAAVAAIAGAPCTACSRASSSIEKPMAPASNTASKADDRS